ncbi:VanW family protein [Candidatus Peregrinibacteria bacterium]|nr:VanW family protein [Candidatus Peregrinibacteria bacterium]
MRRKNKKHNLSLPSLFLLAVAVITAMGLAERGVIPAKSEAAIFGTHVTPKKRASFAQRSVPNTALYRQAMRLRRRIARHTFVTPSVHALARALGERRKLLTRSVQVTLTASDRKEFPTWTVSLHRYPTWLKGNFSPNDATFRVDRQRIAGFLAENPPEEILPPSDAVLLEILEPEAKGKPMRVKTEGVAKAGYHLPVKGAAELLAASLTHGLAEVTLPLTPAAGRIVNASFEDLGSLELLASGRSDFRGSVPGRIANVKKGLSERVNNVLVPPGEVFSFNSTLGPITAKAGWFEALGIFNGDELRPVTGGGLCQVATTVYRAIVNAGLPIEERRAHSLYVTYYEKYGFGLDATIYPGQQNLTFRNDTGNYILVQAYYDGFEATVNFYGTSDGRKVALDGPYFTANAPEGLTINERALYGNEIAWIQTITRADGTEYKNTILSRYKLLPKSVVAKHVELWRTASAAKEESTHAAAPDLLTDARIQ